MSTVVSLDAWTTEQLLTEVLKRAAGDALALRLMQRMVLHARLSAHDRRPVSVLD